MNNADIYGQYKDLTKDDLGILLADACASNNLDEVKCILTSPELKAHPDVNHNSGEPLITACERGHFSIVEYLLTSPELKEHADPAVGYYEPFSSAIYNGHLNIVKLFMALPKMQEELAQEHGYETVFSMAYSKGRTNIIEYLIFDLDIPKPKKLKESYSTRFPQLAEQVNVMFYRRELEKELASATTTTTNAKRLKI